MVATDPERIGERAALVAEHYEQAGNALEAARWSERAAGFAQRSDLAERRAEAVAACRTQGEFIEGISLTLFD